MNKDNIIVGIDIGTTKIAVIVVLNVRMLVRFFKDVVNSAWEGSPRIGMGPPPWFMKRVGSRFDIG